MSQTWTAGNTLGSFWFSSDCLQRLLCGDCSLPTETAHTAHWSGSSIFNGCHCKGLQNYHGHSGSPPEHNSLKCLLHGYEAAKPQTTARTWCLQFPMSGQTQDLGELDTVTRPERSVGGLGREMEVKATQVHILTLIFPSAGDKNSWSPSFFFWKTG